MIGTFWPLRKLGIRLTIHHHEKGDVTNPKTTVLNNAHLEPLVDLGYYYKTILMVLFPQWYDLDTGYWILTVYKGIRNGY